MALRTSTCSLLIATGALVGCEQVVELGDAGDKQIVIDSQLRAGASAVVNIKVLNSFGARADTDWLDEANGTLTGSDGRVDSLRVSSSGRSTAVLVTDSLVVAEGVTYILDLRAPGFAPLTSVTTVPTTAQLSRIAAQEDTLQSRVDSSVISLPFVFADVRDVDNFFYLMVSLSEGSGGPAQPIAGGVLRSVEDVTASRNGSWVFDDREFANGTYVGRIEFGLDQLAGYEHPTATIELRTVSRAYYTHLRTLQRRGAKPAFDAYTGDPADNVINGGGLFGSYAVSVVRQALR